MQVQRGREWGPTQHTPECAASNAWGAWLPRRLDLVLRVDGGDVGSHVVVGIDGSDGALRAVEWAQQVLRARDAAA